VNATSNSSTTIHVNHIFNLAINCDFRRQHFSLDVDDNVTSISTSTSAQPQLQLQCQPGPRAKIRIHINLTLNFAINFEFRV
jgi:hypothetical protein